MEFEEVVIIITNLVTNLIVTIKVVIVIIVINLVITTKVIVIIVNEVHVAFLKLASHERR